MKTKKSIILFLIIIILVAITSCSNKEPVNEASNTKAPKAEIKIDVMRHEGYLLAAIGDFNKTHENIWINYGDTISYIDEEYKNKYITSLAVGEGPDIIRIEPRQGLISAVYKSANSGIFYDLNKLIDKDENFKLSDYSQKVMDSGIIDGKRVFMPLGYNYRVFFAKEEAFKQNGFITEGSKWTLGNLADEAYRYRQQNKDSGKYFMVSQNFSLSDVVKISGLSFIDQEKKKAKLNSQEFIDLLNIYKKLSPAIITTGGIYMRVSSNEYSISMSCPEFDNGTALVMDNKLSAEMWFRDTVNENASLFPQYTNDKSLLVEPVIAYAINSNSTHKEEAYEFLKQLLSEEYQTISGTNRNFPYLPVNNNAYINNVSSYISNLSNTQTDNDVYDREKRKAQVKAQLKEIESISRCDTVDAQIYDIIDSEAQSFINGKRTAEQTAEIIQNKVMLYLNE